MNIYGRKKFKLTSTKQILSPPPDTLRKIRWFFSRIYLGSDKLQFFRQFSSRPENLGEPNRTRGFNGSVLPGELWFSIPISPIKHNFSNFLYFLLAYVLNEKSKNSQFCKFKGCWFLDQHGIELRRKHRMYLALVSPLWADNASSAKIVFFSPYYIFRIVYTFQDTNLRLN